MQNIRYYRYNNGLLYKIKNNHIMYMWNRGLSYWMHTGYLNPEYGYKGLSEINEDELFLEMI